MAEGLGPLLANVRLANPVADGEEHEGKLADTVAVVDRRSTGIRSRNRAKRFAGGRVASS